MKKRIIYHGSREIVAEPGIRITKFNKDFILGSIAHYLKNRQNDGQPVLEMMVMLMCTII
jgi:hypothetical protein